MRCVRIVVAWLAVAVLTVSAACMRRADTPPGGPPASSKPAGSAVPAILTSAEELVDALDANTQPNPDNAYATPSRVVWGTPGRPETYRAVSHFTTVAGYGYLVLYADRPVGRMDGAPAVVRAGAFHSRFLPRRDR